MSIAKWLGLEKTKVVYKYVEKKKNPKRPKRDGSYYRRALQENRGENLTAWFPLEDLKWVIDSSESVGGNVSEVIRSCVQSVKNENRQ